MTPDPSAAPLDAPRAVREGEELALEPLLKHLQDHPDEIGGPLGPLTVRQFPGGYSNLTYLVSTGDRNWVLRRPPFGSHVRTGHDMGREFRVLTRLSAVYPPAPRPLLFCEDESVLGVPFYLMERRAGIILRRGAPPGIDLPPELVSRMSAAVLRNLADLHAVDYRAAGLADLGKPEGYVERQVTGWTERWRGSRTDDVPDMETAAAWLARNRPPESGAALVHNDYKYDNLVLDPDDPARIVAVLDWEMATIGDPLMDLGTTLGYWVEAGDDPARQVLITGPTALPGSPTRRELAETYASLTGRDVSNMLFFYVFALFKIAVIAQQIYFRYRKGQTKDPRFGTLDQVVRLLGRTAVGAIETGRY